MFHCKKKKKESVMSNLRTHIYLHILFLIIPCYNILVQSWCKNVNTLCILYYSIYIYFERTTCKNTSRYWNSYFFVSKYMQLNKAGNTNLVRFWLKLPLHLKKSLNFIFLFYVFPIWEGYAWMLLLYSLMFGITV